jgi:4,5-dihydroxyphthalate decarboxylase
MARLKTLMGDYPVTKQFRTLTDRFDFAEFKGSPATMFKRVVREHELDVAELAIMTYLVAKAHRTPYRLLPFVAVARFQHPYLRFNAERTPNLKPEDLEGKRVGVRSYSVTTGTWVRSVLMEDHGVDIARVNWVTFEEPHVAEFRDPPNVQRAPAGKDITGMLLAGELDAAILGAIPTDERLKPLIRDLEGGARRWQERHGGAIQLNHLVVVRESMPKADADEVYRLLLESKKAAGDPPHLKHGIEPNRHNLEVAVDCALRQGMIPRRFTVEELFE